MLFFVTMSLFGLLIWIFFFAIFFIISYHVYVFFFRKKYTFKNHSGKTVLVTGGSEGIGKSIALETAKDGAKNVIIVARSIEKLEKAKLEIENYMKNNQKCFYFQCDVSVLAEVENLIPKICENVRVNTIDLLYCNAGFSEPGYFLEQTSELFERTMKVNYLGSYFFLKTIQGCVNFTKAFLPFMVDLEKPLDHKHIIYVSSACAYSNFIGYSSYSPTKHAIRSFAECMENEFVDCFNIHFHVSFPPDTDTKGREEEMKKLPPETKIIGETGGLELPESVALCIIKSLKKGRFYLASGFEILGLMYSGKGIGIIDECPFLCFAKQIFFTLCLYLPMYFNIFEKHSRKGAAKRVERWKLILERAKEKQS